MRFLYIKIESRIFVFVVFCLIAFLGIFFIEFYPKIFQVYPEPQKIKAYQVAPQDSIKITFNYAVSSNSFIPSQNFCIEPEIRGDIIWQDITIPGFYKTIVFKPEIPFNLSSIYTIKLTNLRSIYGTRLKSYTFSFSTIQVPKIKETVPKDKTQEVTIDSDIKIILSRPNDFFDFHFNIEPEVGFEIIPNQKKSIYTLRFKQKLKQFTDYTLSVATHYDFKSKNQSEIEGLSKEGLINTKKVSFKTKKPLRIIKIVPEDGQDKVSTEQKIEISFSELVNYEKLEEHLIISPEIEAEFIWQDAKLALVPHEPLREDTEYEVKITPGIEGYHNGSYLEKEVVCHFKTRPSFSERLLSKTEVEPKIKEGKYIDIDIASQTLTIFEDGKSRGRFKVSTGKPSMPTPRKNFKVLGKEINHWSHKYKLYMPFSLNLGGGMYIHELPYWPDGYREGEAHLGIPVSHGCIRLGIGPAEEVYKWTDVGTLVVIH